MKGYYCPRNFRSLFGAEI